MINKIKFIKGKEKEEILNKVKEEYNIKKPNFLLIEMSDRVYGYTGNLSKEEILTLNKILNIKKIGVFFFKLGDFSRS